MDERLKFIIIVAALLTTFGIIQPTEPSEYSIPFDKTIEKMAAERGIEVIEVENFENKFVEMAFFAGAGGIASPMAGINTPEDFFRLLPNDCKIILVDTQPDYYGDTVERTYYAPLSWKTEEGVPVLVKFSRSYSTAGAAYGIETIGKDKIILKKWYFL